MAVSDLTVSEIDTAIRSVLQNGEYVASNGDVFRKPQLPQLQAFRSKIITETRTTSFFGNQKIIIPYRGD